MKKGLRHSTGATASLVIFLTLIVFAAAIYLETIFLRGKIRSQMASRDAEILHAVATMEFGEQSPGATRNAGANPADQLGVILRTSRIKGVIATRLFDADGVFVTALPANVIESHLPTEDLQRLKNLEAVSHFQREADLSDLFLEGSDAAAEGRRGVPLLEVEIPLHLPGQSAVVGIAQFILDGHSIALDFARLDSSLELQASVAFGVGGLIIVFGLGWAFRRLQRANLLLSERTRVLLQANQELSLAAKTSAVGAVTAHLLHGLTNPLSGLQLFVSARALDPRTENDERWREAVALTERMQKMIQDVVSALRDDQASYELTWNELLEIVTAKAQPLAEAVGVRFRGESSLEGVLSNREANLIIMILSNLIQNAIQATPHGREIRLLLHPEATAAVCEVQDEGGGLPEENKRNLFLPCRSSKTNGNGIGLALCKQLANHLGAELALKTSTSAGCVFVLRLPRTQWRDSSPLAPQRIPC